MGNLLFPGKEVYREPGMAPLKIQFEALRLKPSEVVKLRKIFMKVDVDQSGSIGLKELLDHINLADNRFSTRIFSIFDEDGSGQIDLREFVLSIWNYCTLSKASLAVFAFDLYDTDSTGSLSPNEIDGMLHDLYGAEVTTNPQAKVISNELRAQEMQYSLDVERFTKFIEAHPALLFPAFQIQHILRQRIMGIWFWNNAANRRIKLSEGKYVPVAVLTTLNVNRELYRQYADNSTNPTTPTGVHYKGANYILANTGTFHFRNEQTKFFSALSRRRLGEETADKFGSPQVKTREQRLVEERIDPMDRLYKDIMQKAGTKVISTMPSVASGSGSGRNSKRVVPMDSSSGRDSVTHVSHTASGSRPTSPMPGRPMSPAVHPPESGKSTHSHGNSSRQHLREKRRTFDLPPLQTGDGHVVKTAAAEKRRPMSAVPTSTVVGGGGGLNNRLKAHRHSVT